MHIKFIQTKSLKRIVRSNVLSPNFEPEISQGLQSGLYSKHVPKVPVLVESWSGQVNSGAW